MTTLYLINESAVGYALFQLKGIDEMQVKVSQIQKQIANFGEFSQIVQLKAFHPFGTAEAALHNTLLNGKGETSEDLINFIETNVPKSKKKKIALAFIDTKLGGKVKDQLAYDIKSNDVIMELFRGIRSHLTQFLKSQQFKEEDLIRAQLGLTHAYSRNKISFDVNRQDKPIIQSYAVIELLDKDVNTLSMRLKEWFSWHFPEMVQVVTDNEIYAKLVEFMGDKKNLSDESVQALTEICLSEDIAAQVLQAAKTSTGQELSEIDANCLKQLTARILRLFEYRRTLQDYLKNRMLNVSPNLTTVLGESVGAKLISHAGGLQNLIKYPASTIQILGAEKALFMALKKQGNTPKYGLLYNSSYISRANGQDKGQISRYLANKCAIASRLDYFLLNPTTKFGERLKGQIEERLNFLSNGGTTAKNVDAMAEVMEELKSENLYFQSEGEKLQKDKKDKKKKKKSAAEPVPIEVLEQDIVVEEQKPKKQQKVKTVEE